MLIGVISDTHDKTGATADAVRAMHERGVGLVIHCGDIESPETVLLFAGCPAHFVFGNCDGDRAGLSAAMSGIGAELHGDVGKLEIGDKRLAWTHGHQRDLLAGLTGADFDYVFHGHTHVARDEVIGGTRVINPGAMTRTAVKTFLLLDPETGERESLTVG